jgi:hypothetical protein
MMRECLAAGGTATDAIQYASREIVLLYFSYR